MISIETYLFADHTIVRSPGSSANQIASSNWSRFSARVNPKANVPLSETHVCSSLANSLEPKPMCLAAAMQAPKLARHKQSKIQEEEEEEEEEAMESSSS